MALTRLRTTTGPAVMVMASVVFIVVGSAHGQSGEDDEADRSEAHTEFTIEADLEYAHEDQGDASTNEFTLDDVGLAMKGAWWQAEAGIKYKSGGGGQLIVEEGAVRVGETDEWPWYAQAGRTIVPFGELNSPFGEDPMVALLGETVDDSMELGYGGRRLDIAAGTYQGNVAGAGDFEWVARAKMALPREVELGASWTSDLGESVELREREADARDEIPGTITSGARPVRGWGGYASATLRDVRLELEYIAAIDRFPAGVLDVRELQPSAWNLEASVEPFERWEFTGRLEGSRDMIGDPERQWGIAASRSISEHISTTGEYLHGDFADGEPDRELIGAKLAFEF